MKRTSRPILVTTACLILAAPLGAAEPTLKDTLKGHTDRVALVAFTPDGKSLVSRSYDGTTRLWDLAAGTGVKVGERGLPAPLAFSTDGKTLILSAATIGSMQVCDLAAGKSGVVKDGPQGGVAFSPDGKILVQEDGKRGVRVRELKTPFDPSSAKEPTPIPDAVVAYPGKTEPAVAFSPDGATLAIKTKDDDTMLWDVTAGKSIAVIPNTGGGWFTFGPDGKVLAAECGHKDQFFRLKDRAFRLFDAATGKEIATLAAGPNDPPIHSVVFSPDGKTVASGTIYTVKVWDATTGKGTTLRKPPDTVTPPVVFSPDGKLLAAACSADKTVRLWNVASGKIVAALKDCESTPAFSPDGAMVAAGCRDGAIKLWTLPAGK